MSEREEKGKSGVKGGGGQPGIVLSFLPVSVPRCCVARRLGAGTTLHAAAPPGKVVFARPHRDSCSWGAALRACSWSASRDGHVRGVASRRSRQSCSPSTAASLTSCRAAQTMSTAPSTGTEAHGAPEETLLPGFEGESSGSTNSRRTLCKQGGRPRFERGAPHPLKAGYPGVLPRACGRALCCCIRFRLHRRQRAASGSVCHGAPRRATTTTRPRRTRTHGSRRRARHASCARVGSHGAPRLSWGPTGRWFTRRGTGLLDWMLHTTRPSAITS